ncbi:MAG: hypothetical protein SH848_22080 [Saprospiraceae bacterium]|nr:hypothetical protein [Saprospiraceae bacterium]MDZ4706634.1 hypothetical protein [Saprospiraceae bacterium]
MRRQNKRFFYSNEKKTISGDGKFSFFYGPGAFLGVYDRDRSNRFGDDEISVGVSGTIGLSAWIDRLELYLQVTPRVGGVGAHGGGHGRGVWVAVLFLGVRTTLPRTTGNFHTTAQRSLRGGFRCDRCAVV